MPVGAGKVDGYFWFFINPDGHLPWIARRVMTSPYQRCKVLPLKDGSAYVMIVRKNGFEETWVGFATKDEAEAWIVNKMGQHPKDGTRNIAKQSSYPSSAFKASAPPPPKA